MYCIVPLAGPDCWHPSYGIRALVDCQGEPLVKKAITSRCWYQSGELIDSQILFVVREFEQLSVLVNYLKTTFPGSHIITISHMTRGALLTAASAIGLVSDFHQPLVIDLVDILYEANFSPLQLFQADTNLLGILPYFNSNNEKYSYLEIKNNVVVRTAEKKRISEHASAGTYIFRNSHTFLKALSYSLENFTELQYNSYLFVCPSFNALAKDGIVKAIEVFPTNEMSLSFH